MPLNPPWKGITNFLAEIGAKLLERDIAPTVEVSA